MNKFNSMRRIGVFKMVMSLLEFFMNNHTLYEANNTNFMYSTKERDENVLNVSEIEDN